MGACAAGRGRGSPRRCARSAAKRFLLFFGPSRLFAATAPDASFPNFAYEDGNNSRGRAVHLPRREPTNCQPRESDHRSEHKPSGLARATTFAECLGVESTSGPSHFHERVGNRARIRPDGMFPDNHDCPVQLAKLLGRLPVSRDIPGELGSPERGVRLGRLGLARWAPVPEAPMHEHGNTFLREHQIGPAREVGIDSVTSSTSCPQRPSQAPFEFRHPPVRPHGVARIQGTGGRRFHRLLRWTHVLGKHRTCLGE